MQPGLLVMFLGFGLSSTNWLSLLALMGCALIGLSYRIHVEERYGPDSRPQSANPLGSKQFYGGLHWFCPGDGEALNAQLECPRCKQHLRDLASQLIELHPHKRER